MNIRILSNSVHMNGRIGIDPATLLRFENFVPDVQPAFSSLVLSAWLYHFCQVGTSVMAVATSLVALATGVLPRWLALVGFVVVLVSALMLVGSGGASSPRRLAR